MVARRGFWGCLLLVFVAGWSAAAVEDKPSPALQDFFETEIRPLLSDRCFKCHGDQKPKANLRLTSRAAILQGGDTGPAAIPGKADQSLLIQAVRHENGLKMPPNRRLSQSQIDKLVRWVQLGLPWPESAPTNVAATTRPGPEFQITEAQRHFWSFQPVKVVPPPAVRGTAWPRAALDRFILAALEARGLRPAPAADKRTLIRRATYDLTGLPPAPAEIDAFLADSSPQAFARVLDRLLASPQYGERWGRHWLDVVRYCDSFDARILSGAGTIMDCTEAYRYRDWVVQAFNRDLPYDQFMLNQLAGDLLPSPEPGGINVAGTIATGMLALGNWGGGDADKEKLLTDIVDDQIDVTSRAFLGLTMACARCHDHKFDPLSTEDYYGLAGIFMSTHILQDPGPKTNGPPMLRIPLLSPSQMQQRQQHLARIADLEKQLKQIADEEYAAQARARLPETERYLVAVWDYQQRPKQGSNPPVTLAAFAAERHLVAATLERWIDYLGSGEDRLLTRPNRAVRGNPGVDGLDGGGDTPNVIANSTNKVVGFLNIKLPPHSLSMHPAPAGGVAVAWKSPITGTVRISGRIADADPACGDGVAWKVERRRGRAATELASGDIANGGGQRLADGKGADHLNPVAVQAGDRIALTILPKQNHACDTTVVELEIAELTGPRRVWNVTQDVVPDLHDGGHGNPHRDRHGNRAVWYFYDATSTGSGGAAVPGSALAQWYDVTAKAGDNSDADAVARAAHAVAEALAAADGGKGANARLGADLTSPRSPFWPRGEDQLPAESQARLARLRVELGTLKNAPLPEEIYANGMQEGGCPLSPQVGIHDVRVHIRGRYDRLGKLVPRHFPRILAGDHQAPITQGSGRLQLAQWIADPKNPLTARVLVNRVWQHHFGEGLVRTPGNFGKLGQTPTHPELLDYLADQFVRSGWSIKQLHRTLMLSAVYQQGSVPAAETCKADPDNRLFGHMNRRRLEAEEIRDSLLAVTGRLDWTMRGRASQDFNLPRRTLYLMTVRSDRSSFRELFDAADPTAIADRRIDSTVAPQALFLLNHPFALEQARGLGQRMLRDEPKDMEGKIRRLYVLLFGRLPSDPEVRIGLNLLARTGKAEETERMWEEYCQVLLCTNEFVYLD
jgi:hypothetical protein